MAQHNFVGNEFNHVNTVVKGADKVSTNFANNVFNNVETVLGASDNERLSFDLMKEVARDADVRAALKQLLGELENSGLSQEGRESIAKKSKFFTMEHLANTATVFSTLVSLVPQKIIDLAKSLNI